MNRAWYLLKSCLLTIFGDIKIFHWPMFLVYHPSSFRVKGSDTRDIMAQLKAGDIVMRGYLHYLDGYFIPKGKSGCSHSGVYIGHQQIVHSIAEGSVKDDIIDYCRADKIVVLRPKQGQKWAVEHAIKCEDRNIPYDFNFEPNSRRYYCHEFSASCYPHLNIQQLSGTVFGVFKTPEVFLADSFFTNDNFDLIYHSEIKDLPQKRQEKNPLYLC